MTDVQLSMREKVERLEQSMLHLPQVDCPIRHHFAPGLYAREITIPKGTTVTGAVHKTEHLVVVSMGRLQVMTDEGSKEVGAGEVFTCRAGMKNAVYAIEDSRWTNFLPNPTDEQDPDKLTLVFTESKPSELLGGADNKQVACNLLKEV